MKIYTKTGDNGKTSLFGGKRVWKDDLRICAYGSADELNSILGLAIADLKNKELKKVLSGLQHELFILGADLAAPLQKKNIYTSVPRINKADTSRIESLIDKYDSQLPALRKFIIPGGIKGASLLHHARTVCRRCEREVISLERIEKINKEVKVYLNRLSDLLFVLARFVNFSSSHPEVEWKK